MIPNQDAGDADDLFDEGPPLVARVGTDENGRTHCTIHPDPTSGTRNTTRWITADEDSFVDLETSY